jgi:hypothetical protein
MSKESSTKQSDVITEVIDSEKNLSVSFKSLQPEESTIKSLMLQLLSKDKKIYSNLESLYKKYTLGVEDITKTKPADLKRNFDQYIENVEQQFSAQLKLSDCRMLKSMFNKFDNRVIEVEKSFGGKGEKNNDHLIFTAAFSKTNRSNNCVVSCKNSWSKFYIKGELGSNFFNFYAILVKFWLAESIKKSDIELLQACKILIIRSLVKRKFDEELDTRQDNKKHEENQGPS